MKSTYKALARRVDALGRGETVTIGKRDYWTKVSNNGARDFVVVISRRNDIAGAPAFIEIDFDYLKKVQSAYLRESGII